MNVLLHGATNKSNFGDYLYADLIFTFFLQYTENVNFYEHFQFGISDFFKNELGYNKNTTKLKNADLLIYLPGGYFCQRTKSYKELIVRYFRYCKIGLYFLKNKKPIYITGVGGGPVYSKFLNKIYCKIIGNSKLVTFRDNYSKEYFASCNINDQITETMDLIVSLDKNRIPKLDKTVDKEINNKLKDKKIIFLHLHNNNSVNNNILNKIVPAINKFILEHDEYGVIVGYDMLDKNIDKNKDKIMEAINTKHKFYYSYNSAWQLCALINKIDVIVTTKLHVGVVGCVLNKSVLSFPMHFIKTSRFYKQINEQARCISLDNVDDNIVLEQLNNYYDKRIEIPKPVIDKSKENYLLLQKQIEKDFGLKINEK